MGGPQGQSYKNTCQKAACRSVCWYSWYSFLDSSMNMAWICLDMFIYIDIYIYIIYILYIYILYIYMLTYLKMYFDMDI